MFQKEMRLLKDLTKVMDVHDDYFVSLDEVRAFKRKEMLKIIQRHFDKLKRPPKSRHKKFRPSKKRIL